MEPQETLSEEDMDTITIQQEEIEAWLEFIDLSEKVVKLLGGKSQIEEFKVLECMCILLYLAIVHCTIFAKRFHLTY